jgi:hypothetical protein
VDWRGGGGGACVSCPTARFRSADSRHLLLFVVRMRVCVLFVNKDRRKSAEVQSALDASQADALGQDSMSDLQRLRAMSLQKKVGVKVSDLFRSTSSRLSHPNLLFSNFYFACRADKVRGGLQTAHIHGCARVCVRSCACLHTGSEWCRWRSGGGNAGVHVGARWLRRSRSSPPPLCNQTCGTGQSINWLVIAGRKGAEVYAACFNQGAARRRQSVQLDIVACEAHFFRLVWKLFTNG